MIWISRDSSDVSISHEYLENIFNVPSSGEQPTQVLQG